MTTTINFNQTPEELIIELFNAENGFDFSTNQMQVLPGYRDLLTGRRQAEVELLDSAVMAEFDIDIPYATINFRPIYLVELFANIPLELREYDIVNEQGTVAPLKVYSEMLRKYGILMRPETFTVREEEGLYYIAAHESNRAYKGECVISLTASLTTRVATTELIGFFSKPSLLYEVTDVTLSPFDKSLLTAFNTKRVTWFQNFTIISDYLTVENGLLTQPDTLGRELIKMGVPAIPADQAVTLRAVRTTSGENPKYTYILRTLGLADEDTHYIHFYGE